MDALEVKLSKNPNAANNEYQFYIPVDVLWRTPAAKALRGDIPDSHHDMAYVLTNRTGVQFEQNMVYDETGKRIDAYVLTIDKNEIERFRGQEDGLKIGNKFRSGDVAHAIGRVKELVESAHINGGSGIALKMPDIVPFYDEGMHQTRPLVVGAFDGKEWLKHLTQALPLDVVDGGRASNKIVGFRLPDHAVTDFSPEFLDYHLAKEVSTHARLGASKGLEIISAKDGREPVLYMGYQVVATGRDDPYERALGSVRNELLELSSASRDRKWQLDFNPPTTVGQVMQKI